MLLRCIKSYAKIVFGTVLLTTCIVYLLLYTNAEVKDPNEVGNGMPTVAGDEDPVILVDPLNSKILEEIKSKPMLETAATLEQHTTTYLPAKGRLWRYDADDLEQVIANRREKADRVCNEKYGFGSESYENRFNHALHVIQSSKVLPSTYLVDEDNRILYCMIPKVASTTWRKILLFLSLNSTYPSLHAIDDLTVHDVNKWPTHVSVKPLSFFHSREEKLDRLVNYTKVVWVRNPLLRLVSAWGDKLSSRDAFYHKWRGEPILSRYRYNLTSKNVSQSLESLMRAANDTSPVTLTEFFTFLLNEVKQVSMNDVHWSHYNVQCLPCCLRYDYVLRMERWYPEADYFLKKILLKDHPIFGPSADGSFEAEPQLPDEILNALQHAVASRKAKDDHWRELIAKQSKKLVDAVKKHYLRDFDIFGYDPNEF